ncbi:MAG: LPS-assembly protein LptD [Pseudomonadota bacterium]
MQSRLLRSPSRRALSCGLVGVLAIAGGVVISAQNGVPLVPPASAQAVPGFAETDPNAQLFLEADQLLYDDAANTVTAIGSVKILYDGYTVDADEVIYDRARNRVAARGNVVLIEPTGDVIRASSADLSDTLADGFVQALRVETTDRTFFTARNATRSEGSVTVFEDGTYTACESCPDNPDRPRAWTFNADRITYDQDDKMVYYRNVRLDLFGVPVVWLPFFAHADPTVERQSGFLQPQFLQDNRLGFGVRTPYYFALNPSYDLTVTPTTYTRQGVHLDALWRQRLERGGFTLRASGIHQLNSDEFAGQTGDRDFRWGFETTGDYRFNSRWRAGWNAYWQSDRNYFDDYGINVEDESEIFVQTFLTGLHDRSYANITQRLELETLDTETQAVTQNQAWTLPVFDYDRRFTPGTFGGEAFLQANVINLRREDAFIDTLSVNGTTVQSFEGVNGQYGRATLEGGWRREFIGPLGQVFTPQLGFRGDAIGYGIDSASAAVFADTDTTLFRGMASAGLEWRWPFLISSPGGSHVVEPVAQIIARPDATNVNNIPIEDSQSLVFDATNLFDWDKFSGYDQLEGGTRANVGVRYTGTLENGLSLSGLVGQSFHLAGENPYAQSQAGANILTPNGADSGLETDESDYVGMVTARLREHLSLTASARLDEEDLSLERSELVAATARGPLSGSATYAYLAEQPLRGINDDEHQVTGAAAYAFDSGWQVAGGVQYDLENSDLLGYGASLRYLCDCFGVGLNYVFIAPEANSGVSESRFSLNITLRTIGAVETSLGENGLTSAFTQE